MWYLGLLVYKDESSDGRPAILVSIGYGQCVISEIHFNMNGESVKEPEKPHQKIQLWLTPVLVFFLRFALYLKILLLNFCWIFLCQVSGSIHRQGKLNFDLYILFIEKQKLTFELCCGMKKYPFDPLHQYSPENRHRILGIVVRGEEHCSSKYWNL